MLIRFLTVIAFVLAIVASVAVTLLRGMLLPLAVVVLMKKGCVPWWPIIW